MNFRLRSTLAMAALGALLVGTLAAPVAAQEPQASDPARRDLFDEMPTTIAGLDAEISITRGAEHVNNLDPDDAADAAVVAGLERLFDATGVTVDDMTSAYALVSVDDVFSFVVAVRLDGAAPGTVLPAYLSILTAGLIDPVFEEATVAEKDLLVITSDGTDGERVELYVVEVGDTLWMLQGPEDVVLTNLARLPEPQDRDR